MDLQIHHQVVNQDRGKVDNHRVEAQVVPEVDLIQVEDLLVNPMAQDLDQIQEVDLTGVQVGQAAEEDQMDLGPEGRVELQIQKNLMNLHKNKQNPGVVMGVQQIQFQMQQSHLAQIAVVVDQVDQKLE